MAEDDMRRGKTIVLRIYEAYGGHAAAVLKR